MLSGLCQREKSPWAPSRLAAVFPGVWSGVNVEKTVVIVATRAATPEAFLANTATGRSLAMQAAADVEIRVAPGNRRGLPSVYNESIREFAGSPCKLLFVHDDIHILDFFWKDQMDLALKAYDVVGLAGNVRRVPRQPAWCHVAEGQWDSLDNLSGAVGHGKGFPPGNLSVYGPTPREVKLLDGLFLAVRSETLAEYRLAFDERFDFHFYDLDFCREAEKRGLALGTWPISVVHESGGHMDSPAWREGYQRYLEKWGA